MSACDRCEFLEGLAERSIAFLAIAASSGVHPKGRLNAADLILEIQEALGREKRDPLSPELRRELEAEWALFRSAISHAKS